MFFKSQRASILILLLAMLTLVVVVAIVRTQMKNLVPQKNWQEVITSKQGSNTESPENTTDQTFTSNPARTKAILVHYENKDIGISFDYRQDGILSERQDITENLSEIELYYDQRSRIFITYESNPDKNNPKEWFVVNRSRYNELTVVNGEMEIQGNPALFLGVPDTCVSVPVIVVIISSINRVFIITYFETASRAYAEDLGQILESISFGDRPKTPQSVSKKYLEFPKLSADVACP